VAQVCQVVFVSCQENSLAWGKGGERRVRNRRKEELVFKAGLYEHGNKMLAFANIS